MTFFTAHIFVELWAASLAGSGFEIPQLPMLPLRPLSYLSPSTAKGPIIVTPWDLRKHVWAYLNNST